MGQRIAVIGSGISGLSAAWLLSRNHDVTVIENQPRLGGHSNTVIAELPDGPVAVDTGFIVYNERNYPNLTALFDHFSVPTAPTEMSFAVSVDHGRMEYSGEHLRGLFGQRRNIVRMEHWILVSDILRFFRTAQQQVGLCQPGMTIGEFLEKHGYSRAFVEDHILPMSAAIWSTPARGMLDFPAATFIEFFANHGLLTLGARPTWRTVLGGSIEYVNRLAADTQGRFMTGAHIQSVMRHAGGVEIFLGSGERLHFDQVVFACHADQARALLADPTAEEHNLLSAFRYTTNRAVLHTDSRFMPRRRHLWAAWNYLRTGLNEEPMLSVSYWMNCLQPLKTRADLFVTLNPAVEPAAGSVIKDIDYEHPLFDNAAMAAQNDVWRIQGRQNTWFAGAWLGYGFHEDGLQSGLEVAERIGPAARPWAVGEARGRIAHNWQGADSIRMAAE